MAEELTSSVYSDEISLENDDLDKLISSVDGLDDDIAIQESFDKSIVNVRIYIFDKQSFYFRSFLATL